MPDAKFPGHINFMRKWQIRITFKIYFSPFEDICTPKIINALQGLILLLNFFFVIFGHNGPPLLTFHKKNADFLNFRQKFSLSFGFGFLLIANKKKKNKFWIWVYFCWYQKVSLQIPPPFFPPARSAGKFFSKEFPNKKILLQIYPDTPPSFPEKTGQGGGGYLEWYLLIGKRQLKHHLNFLLLNFII